MRIQRFVRKTVAAALSITLVSTMLTGCGRKEPTNTDSSTTSTTQVLSQTSTDNKSEEKKLTGSITMVGSTSMEKLALAVAEDFMSKNPGVTVTAEFVGSGAGIEAVTKGTCNIGNSSRNLKDSEKQAGAVENIVAIDGIAVVVNNKNAVSAVTKDQLIDIYTGQVKNWSELGGEDSPIVVIGREAGSGTRGAFEEILKVQDVCIYANELDNTGAVMAKVASTDGAIGYVSLDVVDDTVKALALDGASATAENVKNQSYSLSRPFVMATKGAISEQSELIQAFFAYMSSDDGKAMIQSVGLIVAD